ncbi:FG-GAP-like repeat-containing protein [Streptomyces aidingensis]|uniref:Repeat domain-containing protein n=1 Tax=Streptomyces aidingensis TaxID=910347 RepID=A0A1I1QYP2_9ACTN|nr:FG-GAP-like repeat-containing protein [Streptomyces aidingensis]SFD27087.1 Repeat domain-containing protein [Streptomyces aidingensis]
MNHRWLRLPPPGRRRTAALAAVTAAAVTAAALGITQLSDDSGDDAPSASGTQRPDGPLDESTAQRLARETGKPEEVTAMRDAHSTTFALPDGSFEYTTHVSPVRALVDGEWREIDTTLEPTADGGWSPVAVNSPVEFSGGDAAAASAAAEPAAETEPERASRAAARPAAFPLAEDDDGAQWSELVTLTAGEAGEHELTVHWPGPLPEPVVTGPRALYQEVLPGVDLLLTARDSGFSQLLVVKTAQAAAGGALEEIHYRLSSPGLSFELDPVTRVVRAKDGEGRDVAVSPTPYMWDSAGEPAVTEGGDPPAESEGEGDGEPGSGPAAGLPAAAQQVLALRGLAGPDPGTHDAVGGAALDHATGVLTIIPDPVLLGDEDTEYPVFVDPSFKAGTNNWTTAYAKYPDSSYWNGQNFNDGTNTARVGWESTTGGLSRSYFQLQWDRDLKGAKVSSAHFYARETYSWSCERRSVELWRTGSISPSTTWNNRPARVERVDAKSVAHGYSSACPDEWVKFTATNLAQTAATAGWNIITVGLEAGNESDDYAWKKFATNGSASPYLKAVYNRPPTEPAGLHMSGGLGCDTTGGISVGLRDAINFAATATDPDGDLSKLHFQMWREGLNTDKILDRTVSVDSAGHAWTGVSTTATPEQPQAMQDGARYWWRVRALDSTWTTSSFAPPGTGNCGFVYDSSAPSSPVVVPPDDGPEDFPEENDAGDAWSRVKFGTAGTIRFGPGGTNENIVRFEYSFESRAYDKDALPGADGTATVTTFKPPHAGPNTVYVRAVDGAGNVSAGTAYHFYVTPRDTADSPGDTSGDGYPDLFVVNPDGTLKSLPGDSTGDMYRSILGAHDNGRPAPSGYWTDDGGNSALITHNGDFLPGDGLTDLVARVPDSDNDPANGLTPALYVYPGDGYGSVDIGRRVRVLLPDDGPDAAALTEIKAVGDVTGDGRPDLFAVAGDEFWAFTGYTGGAFAQAVRLIGHSWAGRDIVTVADVSGDGVADLIYRNRSSGYLWLREGKPAQGGDGGVDLLSLGSSGASAGGADTVYGSGWTPAAHPLIMGTPDTNGDGIPDIWTVLSDGSLRVYHATRTSVGDWTTVFGSGWADKPAIG